MRLDMLQKQKLLETAAKVTYEDKILSGIFVSARSVEKVKTVYFQPEVYVTETSTVSLTVTDPIPLPHSSPSTIDYKSVFVSTEEMVTESSKVFENPTVLATISSIESVTDTTVMATLATMVPEFSIPTTFVSTLEFTTSVTVTPEPVVTLMTPETTTIPVRATSIDPDIRLKKVQQWVDSERSRMFIDQPYAALTDSPVKKRKISKKAKDMSSGIVEKGMMAREKEYDRKRDEEARILYEKTLYSEDLSSSTTPVPKMSISSDKQEPVSLATSPVTFPDFGMLDRTTERGSYMLSLDLGTVSGQAILTGLIGSGNIYFFLYTSNVIK